MRGRLLISALLVLALLPVSSFGAICELNCCTVVVPKLMAMSSMERTSAHRASLISHHQHQFKVQQSTQNQNAVIAAGTPEQAAIAQVCCPRNQTVSSASCGAQEQSALQEPSKTPTIGGSPSVLRTYASICSPDLQVLNQIDLLPTPVRAELPAPLTLRI